LPERYSVSVPPVTNNIYRSAVPAQNYLPERRSAAFRHHYSPVQTFQSFVVIFSLQFRELNILVNLLLCTLYLCRNEMTNKHGCVNVSDVVIMW